MGTSYRIFDKDEMSLTLDEMSNELDMVLFGYDGKLDFVAYRDLTPEEVIEIALKMLQVASYWVEDNQKMLKETAAKVLKL